MCGPNNRSSAGAQSIHVALANETINVPANKGGIQFSIKEERFDFSSPLVLATSGWPFGPNPNKVEGITKDVATVVDEVVMPTFYRVTKWLFLISDEVNDLEVTSEIKCMRRGDNVHFVEYAILGDSGLLPYDIDVVVNEEKIQLVVTSRYDSGAVTIRTAKIGLFN